MHAKSTTPIYGLYRCQSTALTIPATTAPDLCAVEWADELPPLWADEDEWPSCPCCGRGGELIVPLVAVNG